MRLNSGAVVVQDDVDLGGDIRWMMFDEVDIRSGSLSNINFFVVCSRLCRRATRLLLGYDTGVLALLGYTGGHLEGGVVFEHIENKPLLNGLFHRVQVKRLQLLASRIAPAK